MIWDGMLTFCSRSRGGNSGVCLENVPATVLAILPRALVYFVIVNRQAEQVVVFVDLDTSAPDPAFVIESPPRYQEAPDKKVKSTSV
jgi:hypothetical protein